MIGVIEMRQSYAIEIFFSDEDEGFIPTVPELPGCSAFGETEEEALSEVKVAIGLWLDTTRQEGREITELSGREHLRDILPTFPPIHNEPDSKWLYLV